MKKKDILFYMSTFILLAISFLMFILAFIGVNKMIYYIYSGIFLVLFCVLNRITEKKIRCSDGYNLVQAYFFYKKCEKNGVGTKASKIKEDEMQIVSQIAAGYDYCKKFDEKQLTELYRHGREARIALEQKK